MSNYSEFCVYTIKHSKDLESVFKSNGEATFTERTNWKTGFELLRRAQEYNHVMPILFCYAESTRELVYRAKLAGIRIQQVTEKGFKTEYSFTDLVKLKGNHLKTDILLKSTGQRISEDFIRPYAICYTPIFI